MKQISDELYNLLKDNLKLEDHGSSKSLVLKNSSNNTLVILSEVAYASLIAELESILK